MLFISLILSALLLLIANGVAWRVRHAGTSMTCSILAFVAGPFFMMCVLPAVALQALLLCGALIFWRTTHRGPSFFLPLSCGATLFAYGISGIIVLESEREYARLRDRYPYESMEGRLPALQAVAGSTSLLPDTAQRLSRLEGEISGRGTGYRESQLRRLHEDAVGLFINSPGFGIARLGLPSESGLAVGMRREPPPLQPGSRFTSMWSPGEVERLPAGDEQPLSHILEGSILDFVKPWGFGYVKDRRHVTGFQPHRFR